MYLQEQSLYVHVFYGFSRKFQEFWTNVMAMIALYKFSCRFNELSTVFVSMFYVCKLDTSSINIITWLKTGIIHYPIDLQYSAVDLQCVSKTLQLEG